MLSILYLFLYVLMLVLIISAFCGLIGFFIDLHNFKSEKEMSLPRKKLIDSLLFNSDMEKSAEEDTEKVIEDITKTYESTESRW